MADRTAAPGNAVARAAGDHADRVRMLFDSKAVSWPGKYASGGRLTGRLAQLAGAVRELAVPGGELLDLGCGSGDLARHLAAAGYRVTGCDIAPRMLEQAAEADRDRAVRWLLLDPGWRALPFPAGSLDAVVAASVLEYVPDPAMVLGECARVLRPGGILVCTVPDVAHPVRWLEWPLGWGARTLLAGAGRDATGRFGQYLAYLRTSRQRRPSRQWGAMGQRAGLDGLPLTRSPREPLRLLAFTRSPDTARDQARPARTGGDERNGGGGS